MIRLGKPAIQPADLDLVRDVVASGNLVQGELVARFEQEIAAYVGCREAIAVSSGTAALHLALLALGVGPGDRVILPAYSFIATANAVAISGAEPVFVDVDPDSHAMCPARLDQALERLAREDPPARVAAIVPVHPFGRMAPMPEILELAGRRDIPVVEDAACALGAAIGTRKAGCWGTLGCLSFHPRKILTTGEGGMVLSDDDRLADAIRALRNHGIRVSDHGPDSTMPGFNYRMTELAAALGLPQFARLESTLERLDELAATYDTLLAGRSWLRTWRRPTGTRPVYQAYVVEVDTDQGPDQQTIRQRARDAGVEIGIGTWHMPLAGWCRDHYHHRPGDFPVTDRIAAQSLSLPLHLELDRSQQERVVEVLTHGLD